MITIRQDALAYNIQIKCQYNILFYFSDKHVAKHGQLVKRDYSDSLILCRRLKDYYYAFYKVIENGPCKITQSSGKYHLYICILADPAQRYM